MHSEATRSLYSMVGRLTALGRSRVLGDPDTISVMAPLNLLFEDRWSHGKTLVRMTDISQRMMISKPAATQVVNRLVERGLVERASDENDRRVVYIRATEAGRAFYEQEIGKSMSAVDRVVERMGEADANHLVALLDKFFDAFDEVGIPLGIPGSAGDQTATEDMHKC